MKIKNYSTAYMDLLKSKVILNFIVQNWKCLLFPEKHFKIEIY